MYLAELFTREWVGNWVYGDLIVSEHCSKWLDRGLTSMPIYQEVCSSEHRAFNLAPYLSGSHIYPKP
jgi:hypothetical protein